MDSIKGDGPYTHGNSFANGPAMPAALRLNWELREVLDTRYCLWTVMA
jgi:hypothetical protein